MTSLLDTLTRQSPANPLAAVDALDDFVTGTATNGSIGVLGWTIAGGAINSPASVAGHPGIVQRDTGASSGTTGYMISRTLSSAGVFLASEFFDVTWVFRLNSNDADTRVRLGLSGDWSSNTPANGIYLEKTLADTSWFATCRASSAETRSAALAAVDTGWHKIRMRRIDASTIGFTLDALAEVAVTGNNVPGAVAVQPGMHIFNNVASSKTIDLDLFRLRISGLAR